MKYKNLLSPLVVRNHVLKNRLEATISMPHFSQGPEKYPGLENMFHFIGRAKNGAAIVTLTGVNGELGMPDFPQEDDVAHFPSFDIYDTKCQNYMVQLTEAIHSYGAVVSMGLVPASNTYPYFNERGEMELVVGAGPADGKSKLSLVGSADIGDDLPTETLEKIAASHGQQAKQLKFLGFDMITLHMSYRATLMAKMLSPLTNKRTDGFGGAIEGRAKFPLMVLKSIRDAVGPDFIIELHISGKEPEGGNTTEDVAAFLRLAEQYADIAQIRCGEIDPNHPTGFCLEETPMLATAEKIKKSGVRMRISCVGGWLNPDHIEESLAAGKLDMVSAARAWISNPDYVSLIQQERAEDIVPCVRCNRCHGRSDKDTFASVCTVNPVLGQERFLNSMVKPAERKKNVAVIGGGPGGMQAAMVLADRGHSVTLYEAADRLGGALRHTDYVSFKWPLRDYKNYLIRQVEKRNITVLLNTKAAKETLLGRYDAIVAAVGSAPIRPPLPGAESDHVIFATQALENAGLAGDCVIVIGGGEVGIETGMYLAQQGKQVTVLETRGRIAADATAIHYRSMMKEVWQKTKGLTTKVNVKVTEIEKNAVRYLDAEGKEQTLPADTVILACGMRPCVGPAISLYGCADEFYMIGDCQKQGTVQTTIRSAYYTANII